MGGIKVTQRFRIAKIVPFRYPRWPPHLEILQTTSPKRQVRLSQNLMWGITVTVVRDSELLKLFRSDIQDGRHVGHLEIHQMISPPKPCQIEPKLYRRHRSDIEIQICKDCSVPISMAAILKFFKRHLLPNRKLDWAKTWWEASQWHRDSELPWWPSWNFSNDISSKTLNQTEPKLDGRHRSDIEIQNC